MIGVATTIKDDTTDALLLRPLGHQLAHLTSDRNLAVIGNSNEGFDRRLCRAFLGWSQHGLYLRTRFAALLRLRSLRWRFRSLLRPFAFCRSRLSRCFHPRFILGSGPLLTLRGSFHLRLKAPQNLFQRRCPGQCLAGRIVNNLRIDMMSTAEDAQAWPLL